MLAGGGGNDIFIFTDDGVNGDTDIVTDFTDGSDTLDLSAIYGSIAEATAAATQNGSDVVFDLGDTNQLIVENITVSQILDDIFV